MSNFTFYHLKRSNIIHREQRDGSVGNDQTSKGINFSISGSPTPNLDMIANISYNKNTTIQLFSSPEGSTIGEAIPLEENSDRQSLITAKIFANSWINYSGWKNLSISLSVCNFTDKYYYKSSLGISGMVEEGDPRGYFLTIKSKNNF